MIKNEHSDLFLGVKQGKIKLINIINILIYIILYIYIYIYILQYWGLNSGFIA
jgi:hypothetical protein